MQEVKEIDADEINERFIEMEVFVFQNEELELGYHEAGNGNNGIKRCEKGNDKKMGNGRSKTEGRQVFKSSILPKVD